MATLTAIFQAQDNLSRAMTNAANAGTRTTGAFQKLGKIGSAAMKATGVAIAAASTALLAFGKSAVTAGMGFETSMSQVMATMGMNTATAEGQAAYDTLSAAAEKMGAETAFSASQAADALNYLALAGYSADQAAAALPTVLHLAGAGGMELAKASDMITDSMAALQLEVNQVNLDRFADQLAKTASTTNTSVSQLGEAVKKVGPTAANLRNGTTELNTQLGILANVGIKGSEGGTKLRNILLRLQSPTEKASAMLDKLGVAVYDTDGKMRDTGTIFEDLKNSMAGMDQSQIDQVMSAIFNKTDIAAANALLAASGDEYARIFSIIENSGGAAADMYQTMLDNLKGDVDIFKSAQEALYLSIYKSVNGTLRDLVQTGTGYMNRLNDAFKAGGFEGLVTELGNVLGDATGVIMGYVPKIVEAGVGIVSAFVDSIGDNADTIANAAADIAMRLGAAIVRIAPKLAAAFGKLLGASAKAVLKSIPKLFKAVPDKLYSALGLDKTAVVRKVSQFTNRLGTSISKLLKGDLAGAGEWLAKAFGLAWDKVKATWDKAVSFFASIWDGIKSIFSGGKGKIEGLSWTGIGEKIRTGVGNIAEWFTGLFQSAKEAAEGLSWADVGASIEAGIKTVLDAGGAFLSGAFTAAKAAIEAIPWSAVGEVIGDGIHGIIDVGGAFLSGGFEAAKASIEAIEWGSIGTTIGTAVNNTIDTAGAFLSGCFETAKAAIEGIEWSSIGTTIATGVNGAVDTAGAFLSGSFEAAKVTIEGIDWTTLGTTIANGVNGAVDTAGAFLTGAFEAGKAAIEAIPWSTVGTTIATAVNGSIDTAGAFLSGSFEAAKASIEAVDWAGLGGKVGELATVATSLPLDAISGAFTAAESTINSIDWAGLGANVGGLLNGVTGISSDAISSIFTAAEATINAIDWNALGQTVADGLGRAGGLLAGIGDIGLGLGEAAVGAGQKGVNALKGWVSSWGTESASEAQTVGQQIITDVTSGVTSEVPNLVTSAGEAATAFLNALQEKLTSEAATSIVETFTAGFETIGTDLAAAFEGLDLGAAISAAAEGITLEAQGSAIIDTFTTGMTASSPTATAAMTALGTQIRAIAQAVNLTAQGSNMLKTLTTGMNTGRSAALASARTTGTGIRSAFASVNLYSVGSNIIQGLRNGMQSMFSSLLATARQMAQQLKQTIQSGMEVHSPSRFTDWVGQMTGMGLVEGLESMTRKATAAAAAMALGVTSAFAPLAVAAPAFEAPTVQTYAANRPASVSPYDTLNYTTQQEVTSTQRRSFDININGTGKISIEGLTKKEAAEAVEKSIKPILMEILEEEIFTGGNGVYDF